MTEKGSEIKESPKKTPAEIAADLEKNADLLDIEGKKEDATRKRGLAKKVLATESVTGKTELKLETLQANLPPLEKKDLEDARKVSVVPAVAAGAGVVGLAATANAMSDKLDSTGLGKLGFKDSIKEWITEALSEKPDPEDGFMGSIFHKLQLMFLIPLAKAFGIKLPKKEGEKDEGDSKNGEKKILSPETEKKGKEILDDAGFIAGYKGFVRVYKNSIEGVKDVEASKLDSVFGYAPFRSLTFQKADELYKRYKDDKKGLAREMGMEKAIDPEILYTGLALVVASDGTEFLKKKYSNELGAKDIGTIFTDLKDQFNIAAGLESIEINSLHDIGGFMGEIGKKMDIAFDEEGHVKTPHLKEKVEKLGLNKKDLISYILVHAPHRTIEEFSSKESIEKLELTPESKDKLSEVVAFGNKMEASIAASFSFSNPQVYAEYLKKNHLTLSDTFKLYAILGGKADQTLMSPPEQLYVYQKVWHILGKDTDLRGKYFDKPASESIWNAESKIHIPKEVKAVFINLMSKAVEKFKEKSIGAAKELWGYLDTSTIVAIAAALAAYFIWGKKIGYIFTGATLATLTYTIATILKNSAGSDGKIALPSGKITPEEGAKVFIESAKSQTS